MKKQVSGFLQLWLKLVFPLFIIIFLTLSGRTQNIDSAYRSDFDSFKRSIQDQFNEFHTHNDSVFIQFLEDSWKEIHGTNYEKPALPKPDPQPVFLEEKHNDNQPVPQNDKENIEIQGSADSIPIKFMSAILNEIPSLSFYGKEIPLGKNDIKFPVISELSSLAIKKFYLACLDNSILNNTITELKAKADSYNLNDWGFASLLMQYSGQFAKSHSVSVLFTWYALLHHGYNVKVGYDSKEVFLLVPSNEELYTTYFNLKGNKYYLVDLNRKFRHQGNLFIHEGDYPGNRTHFSFMINEVPQLGFTPYSRKLEYLKPISLKLNEFLIDFFNSYPPCELKVYFSTPLSANACRQLDQIFLPLLEQKNDDERVSILLDYVQHAFAYKTDLLQFGSERYLFADETLYYPAADCDDRAVFLARLIKRYTKLETIGLSYPGHVSLAVKLNAPVKGKYVLYHDERYFHCDPTYLNARIGMPMKTFENLAPDIISYKD